MTQNASLHKVRTTDNGAIFRVDAPSAAAALTRTNGSAENVRKRIIMALPAECQVDIQRGKDGKWYVRAERPACCTREQLRSKKAERISRRDVPDNDGRIAGKFSCGKCAGTGRYITYIENGVPKGPGGECYRCGGKGFHTQADRRRNYGADINYVPRSC